MTLSNPLAEEYFKELQILVVDDAIDSVELLSIYLSQYGAAVTGATSVADAIAKFDQLQPHLLIADIGFPGEDGWSLIHRIRARSPQQGGLVPAIAVTAYAQKEARFRSLQAGFQYCLTKPINLDELLTAICSLTG
ncbi:MAG: response regulator [Oculatellaceae cyanobacterium Prado106]|nr:response regulator [Oculatellaceae cyanobacterium Prado106]